ncbi:MAG: hypothetical protein RJA59_1504 [Pseudomonadota bacterium]|jgi:hypothetical protein
MTGLGVGPKVVDEMDGREISDLMDYWADHPPAHIAAAQVRDVVISALGGTPPSKRPAAKAQSPEQFAAMLGVNLEAP